MLTGNKISTKALMLLGILITILDIILANMSDKKYITMQITEKKQFLFKIISLRIQCVPPHTSNLLQLDLLYIKIF